MREAPSVPGARELAELLGSWPSFHDAEILRIALVRDGVSAIDVDRVPSRSTALAEPGRWIRILFEEVSDIDLQDFNHQNVIAALEIRAEDEGFRITLHPCFGVSGSILAKKAKIETFPTRPGSDCEI